MLRRTKLALAGCAVLGVLGLTGGLIALDRAETIEEHYASYAEAVGAGYEGRGWMPDYVPTTAKQIQGAHNLDTNVQWIAFELPLTDLSQLIAQGRRVTSLPSSRAPFWLKWWPSGLERGGESSLVRVVLPAASLEDVQRRVRCLAVDLEKGRVYAWTCEAEAAA